MSTTTTTETGDSPAVKRKHEHARKIVEAMDGHLRVCYRPDQDMDYGLFDDDGLGHQWYCQIPEGAERFEGMHTWWIDDRNGNFAKQVAESLTKRANLLPKLASRIGKLAKS